MIIFLLNLGCNVTGYLSIQIKMACLPNTWGISLYKFVIESVEINFLWYGLVWFGFMAYQPL